MSSSHPTPGELGFLGGAGWSCGCLGVNGINWEQLVPSKDPPAVPVGGQALVIQLSLTSAQVHPPAAASRAGFGPPLLCSSCPQPNVTVPVCPVVQQICLDKEQDPTCGDESKSHPSKQQGSQW